MLKDLMGVKPMIDEHDIGKFRDIKQIVLCGFIVDTLFLESFIKS